MEYSRRRSKVILNRIYTRQGDQGETRLAGGRRVRKSDPRVEAYGSVDEVISQLGLAICETRRQSSIFRELGVLAKRFERIQQQLFNVGAILATESERLKPGAVEWIPFEVKRLEQEIDRLNSMLPTLSSFVLPGGSELAARIDLCRVACRRAERRCVRLRETEPELPAEVLAYLNRLSDFLFVASRWANKVLGVQELLWDPEAGTAPVADDPEKVDS